MFHHAYSAKFRAFRGWVSYRENKNRESLNVRTTSGLYKHREDAKSKTTKISSEGDTGEIRKTRKFAPANISRYTGRAGRGPHTHKGRGLRDLSLYWYIA